MRISIVVPVRNGGTLFRHLCSSLARTRDAYDADVVIIDSGSSDDTVALARDAGFRVHCIPPSEFGHGSTRNLGVRLAHGDVVCFLTHDVLPCTPSWPLLFAEALAQPGVAGVYGRQVPRDASAMEMFFVSLNYPAEPLRFDPRPDGHHPRPGRVVFSNAFSAVRRDVALRIPFPEEIGYSEDLVWAHSALAAGCSIVYEPRAEALHAHHYTLRGLFRRTYLVGRTLHAYGIGGGASFPESVRFLASEVSWFVRQGHSPRLPHLLVYEFTRWAGFHAGRILGGPGERRRRLTGSGPVVSDTFASEPRQESRR
ncbi:MAG TPA: glycosyltransferase family 2 protein [Longimicrobiales bacterium]|nr:glycosyltransferase family 2 protein [Longimicrobiales bacterium]